jgi:hypothetical protein
MNIDVYDTYVRTSAGDLLHFDVLLPIGESKKVKQYAGEWLESIGEIPQEINFESCRYCHTETATEDIQQRILQHGYFIIQMGSSPRVSVNTNSKGDNP